MELHGSLCKYVPAVKKKIPAKHVLSIHVLRGNNDIKFLLQLITKVAESYNEVI